MRFLLVLVCVHVYVGEIVGECVCARVCVLVHVSVAVQRMRTVECFSHYALRLLGG